MDTIIAENSHPVGMLTRRGGNHRRLFATAFLQVLLVSANTYFISRVAWVGIAACGFGISYLWTLNVRRISAGSPLERMVYATGAMLGGLAGVLLGRMIL